MKNIQYAKLYDFFIIATRVWLAYILFDYGWAKLTSGQFGISQQELNTPLKNLNLFKLSWYLADHEPFKSFVGISQIIAALLLLFRRTTIIGAFMAIPIWLNILIWDITFIGFNSPFTIRLLYYLFLTTLILLHYKQYVFPAIQSSIQKNKPRYSFPLWAYLLLPLVGFTIEFLPFILKKLISLF